MDPIELPERHNPHDHLLIIPVARSPKPTQQPLPRLDVPRERALMGIEQHLRRKRRPWWKFW